LSVFFVDNGHLFGGPNGELRRHFRASRYLDQRIYPSVSSEQLRNIQRGAESVDAGQLSQRVEELPDAWKTSSALENFTNCLSRLSTPGILQNILEAMVSSIAQDNDCDNSGQDSRRKPVASVLRPGVQGTGWGRPRVARVFDHPACA
jgi:hypothetical protein